jgi:predicted N-formylglutamate amidohydrolase
MEELTVHQQPGGASHADSLLGANEPAPFDIIGPDRPSPFLITCDHAGRLLPRSLGDLGLAPADLERHIAWDIGAGDVARRLGAALDAFVITQRYSRLVIDCNRRIGAADSIVTTSEGTAVPGNRAIDPAAAERRAGAIFHPYHDQIRGELDRRAASRRPTILVAVHSFTPRFMDVSRPWHVGVLYVRDDRQAQPLLRLLRAEPNLVVGCNEPYHADELSDFSVVQHGERRGIPYVELEIRQDLISDTAGQAEWAERLARLLPRAAAEIPLS